MYVPKSHASDDSAWDEIAGYDDLKKVGASRGFYTGNPRFGAAVDSLPREIPRNRAENAAQLFEPHSAGVTFRRSPRNGENVDRPSDRARKRLDFSVEEGEGSEGKARSAGEYCG